MSPVNLKNSKASNLNIESPEKPMSMKGSMIGMGRPKILKPVHPPNNREGSNLSGVGGRNFGNQIEAGYMSSG